jgi:allantoin racemase
MRRILLINANTSAVITDRLVALGNGVAPDGVHFLGATARFGARYIASRAASAVAAHAALDCYAEHGAGADAVLLGCFGDPGLDALKEVAPVPVLGLAEAAVNAALAIAPRFGVVTGGTAWGPMLEEFFTGRGLASALAGVRTVAPTGGEMTRDPAGAVALLAEACRTCAEQDGAGVVILGGAGLAGFAAQVAHLVPVPVVCSVEAGLRGAIAALGGTRADMLPHQLVETIGLSPALTRMLSA